MHGPSKKDWIYYYVIHGCYANEIKDFKDIKCSKVYVHKILKQLVIDGYINPIKKSYKSQKKFVRYRKTDKIYPVKLTEYPSTTSDSFITKPRLNLISVKFPLLKQPETLPDGHRFWLGDTPMLDYKHVFDDTTVNFRLISDKWLVVFMPEHLVSADHFRHTKEYLYKRAYRYAEWFMETFNCHVGESSVYQDYEIAVREEDPFLGEMAKKHGQIKIINHRGDVLGWYDFSKGYCEFETTDEDLAEIKAFMPLIVKDLQNRVLSIHGEIEAHSMVLEGLQSKMGEIGDLLKQTQKSFDELKKAWQPEKEKEFDGIGYE